MSRSSIPDNQSSNQLLIGVVAVAAVALAASLAGLRNEFAQDDVYLIQNNLRIHSLGNWREMLTSPFWPPPLNQELYRPFTSLLLALEFALGGGDPLLFRVASYLFYAATAVGVFILAGRLLPRNIALAMGLLFAAHPVHVEAVALGVGQSELLVGLLGLIMTIRYVDRRRQGTLEFRDWALLGALYVSASLLKEPGLMLPGLLLATELFLLPGPAGPRVRSLVGGYAYLAGLGVLVILLRLAVLEGRFAGNFTAEALQGLTMGGRALTMLKVVPQWARLLFWPAHLQADYSPQELIASTRFGLVEALGLVLLLGTLTAGWLARRRAPVFSFGVAWMAIALLPVSNWLIPTGILLAERTLFLPSVGMVLGLGGLVAAGLRSKAGSPSPGRAELRLVTAGLVLAGVVRSGERQRIWRNEVFFSVRSVQDAPRSFRTQRAYGEVLFELGQRELALEAYQRAMVLAPAGQAWRVRNDLARRFRLLEETAPEVEQLRRSLEEQPAQEDTRGYLIAGYLSLGRYADAAREADTALALGATPKVFQGLRALADSAARVGAPPGSVRIRISTGPTERAAWSPSPR